MNSADLIEKLRLEALQPEGGFFRQTFKDKNQLAVGGKTRSASTCIYYLLTRESFSAFHRVPGTEIFHFLRGDCAEMHTIDEAGLLKSRMMGPLLELGQLPQLIVPPLVWQALRIAPGGTFGWALFSTTVSPGFEYEDFQLGKRSAMLQEFPQHRPLISELTRT